MTREEFIGKLRSIYVGEENAIDEIISEYDRLNNIIDELEKFMIDLQKLKGINQQGFSWGVCQECLDKLKELKEE